MFNYIQKVIKYRRTMRSGEEETREAPPEGEDELSEELYKNLQMIRSVIVESNDLVVREFVIAKKVKAAIIYIDGMVDKALINETLLKPLMYHSEMDAPPKTVDIEYVESELLFVGSTASKQKVGEAVDKILSGDTVFLMDGAAKALIIALRGWKTRGIEEPETEATVRGPREGFTETLRINTSMLRRIIKNPKLKFETLQIGDRTKTDVCIAYITDLARPQLIEEVKRRLGKINIDAVLESGYIEQYIEDAPYSIFSTVGNSEKPDKVAAKLLDGRAAILVDGTPFVLTVPCVFIESFQIAEDYYSRTIFASLIRMLRFVAFAISILGPAIYVALTTFHQELIPTQLVLSMAAAHEGVPFPSLVEAAVMLLFFEILREAGVRLPRPIGQAVSIVGALVIGEAAVSAGLIGAPMVIVIAVTAVSSFTIPVQIDSGTIIRIVLLILAGFMGGFGIAIGLFALLIHMVNLKSFGVPYLMPLTPFDKGGLKDSLIRAPLWTMTKRPKGMAMDEVKQKKPSGSPPFNEN
ncbi:MAG: spore germination protein [Oscillospiraceae bacterium]|nr:spore germination protein [Oscillospiraceae bacterium]